MPPAHSAPRVITDRAELREAIHSARTAGKRIGLVPTMGALHAGHLSLVEASNRDCQFTAVTIFVNPTQFGPNEDFSKYPRTLERDLEMLSAHQVDVVFAPPKDQVYRPDHATTIEVAGVAAPLEGVARPGHFRGVATVVLKLFNLIPADVAFFGQKDYQQSLVVQQMVRDLDLPIEVRVCPTVREADGLAMSSRNVYLSPDERRRALTISRSLRLAAELLGAGERSASRVRAQMIDLLEREGQAQVEYVALADPRTLAEVEHLDRPVVALIAVRIGATRLIDNRILEPGGSR